MLGYPTDRVIVYNRDATFAFELTPDEQRSRKRIEEINGEHSLTIKTTRKLSEGMRLVTQDDTGKIREHVVYKSDEDHHEGKCAVGTYLCMWSLQYDLMSSYAKDHAEPGMGSACTSRNAVTAALDGQSLWVVGTCDVPAVTAGKGCVMIGVSAWERLSLVVKHWHGEIDAEIVMDGTRVTERKVNFLAHLGSSEVTRRFDWTEDLTSIERHEDPGPYYCRVVPLGRGEREYAEDDETEFDWPIDITEETGGVEYIEDSESALVFRTKLPDGSYHYPTKVVKYDEDDPELLLNAATEDLHNHTRPGCSYEANVLQFVRAGMDAHGLALGDNTQCVDFGFSPDAGLALEGRVTRLEVEELSPETETNVTIGDLAPTFAQTMQELIGRQTASISDGVRRIEGGGSGSIVYLQTLLDAINAQIAADGGYTYLVGGQGSITYDKAVADPLIGIEATKVTQIKGGGIRIADEKKPSFSDIEDWVWKSLIVSGHIAAELVTAAHITAGHIGSTSSGNYWDLDTGQFMMGNTAQIGNTTVSQLVSSVNSKITGVSVQYAQNQSTTTAPSSGWSTTAPTWRSGYYIWQRTATTNGNGTTYSTPTCISGRDGLDAPESRNYVTQTAAFDGWVPSSSSGHTVTGGSIQMSKVGYGYDYVTYMPEPLNLSLIYNKTLTLSAIVKGEVGKPYNFFAVIRLRHESQGGYSLGYQHYMCGQFTATGGWQTVTSTGVYKRENFDHSTATIDVGVDTFTVGLGMSGSNEVGGSVGDLLTVRGKSVKLEIGDVATPWCAALEDNMGIDGVGVTEIIDQYYLSTSNTTQTGGSWQNTQPAWSSGMYIWTRSQVTWSDGQVTTTTPILAEAINKANENASSAQTAVTTLDTSLNQEGVFNRLTDNGRLQGLYMDGGNLYINASYIKTGTMKAGRIESNSGESYWDLSTGQMRLYSKNSNLKIGRIRNGTGSVDTRIDSLIELGDGMKYTDKYGQVFSLYVDSSASQSDGVTYRNSHMKLTNTQGTAGFYLDTLSLQGSVKLSSDATFYINGGADSQNSNRSRLVINNNGTSPMCDIYGTTRANVTSWSDRRMKEHIAYLSEDACEFIRSLRPALFSYREGLWQSGRHLGFYAQDVSESEPDGWDTETVTQSADELLDYEPFSLDYTALIAPLVAYAQQLELRVDEQQRAIDALTKRLAALEARVG